MSKQKVSKPHDPFTAIPLLYDDIKLSLIDHRLLTHYARVAGSFEGVRTTAKRCHMSADSVIKARNSLAEKGWITVGENDKGTIQVEIVDVWGLDGTIYGGAIERPHAWVAKFSTVREVERALIEISNAAVLKIERDRSRSRTKEDPIRKIPLGKEGAAKKKQRVTSHPLALQVFRAVTHTHVPKKMRDRVVRVIGTDFYDCVEWGRTVKWWMMSGYNITNYRGMLEVFEQRRKSSGPPQIGKFLDDLA